MLGEASCSREGPTCIPCPWRSHGSRKADSRALGPGEGEECQLRASLPLCAGTITLDWKPLPSPESWVPGKPCFPWGCPHCPGVSTSYLQSLAHILLPQKTFPDGSGSCHGSNNSTSIYMCVMSSVDKSQATQPPRNLVEKPILCYLFYP